MKFNIEGNKEQAAELIQEMAGIHQFLLNLDKNIVGAEKKAAALAEYKHWFENETIPDVDKCEMQDIRHFISQFEGLMIELTIKIKVTSDDKYINNFNEYDKINGELNKIVFAEKRFLIKNKCTFA